MARFLEIKDFQDLFVRRKKKPNFWIIAVSALYAVVLVYLTLRHEMWRDEVRALSIAQGASLRDVIRNLHNEGHPPLWYFLLHFAYKLVPSVIVLPAVSLLVAFSSAIIFLSLAPFTVMESLLFLFGLFPLYEYSVVCRNYGISMLLMFIFCSVFPRRLERPLTIGIILALLCLSNFHSLIVVACLAVFLCVEFIKTPRNKLKTSESWHFVLGYGLVLVTAILVLYQTYPDSSSAINKVSVISPFGIIKSSWTFVCSLGQSFTPVFGLTPIMATLTLLGFLLFFLNWIPLFFVFAASLWLTHLFYNLVYSGYPRHQGIILMEAVSLIWISNYLPRSVNLAEFKNAMNHYLRWGFPSFLLLFLGYQCWGAYFFGNNDVRRAVSSSKALGEFIDSRYKLRTAVIMAEPEYLVEALPYYLPDNPLYFPRDQYWGKWKRFSRSSRANYSSDTFFEEAQKIGKSLHLPVLLLVGTNVPWRSEELKNFLEHSEFLQTFDKSTSDENYHVFLIK